MGEAIRILYPLVGHPASRAGAEILARGVAAQLAQPAAARLGQQRGAGGLSGRHGTLQGEHS